MYSIKLTYLLFKLSRFCYSNFNLQLDLFYLIGIFTLIISPLFIFIKMDNINSTFYFGQLDDPVIAIDGRVADNQRGPPTQQFSIASQSAGSVLDPTAAEFTFNMGV